MKNLIQITNNKPTTTSLQVAEYFKKDHSKVLKIIRGLIDNGANFSLVDYTDLKGEKRPMYEMDKSNFTLLAMSFTGKKAIKFKIDYIQAFEAMEKQLQQPKQQLPQNYIQALESLIETEKEKQRLELEAKKNQPKVEFFDNVAQARGLMSVSAVAKLLGTGQNRLFRMLREQGMLKYNNEPYQYYLDQGLFEVKLQTYKFGDKTGVSNKTLVTPKGVQKIEKMLK